jgi:hypothetical protein
VSEAFDPFGATPPRNAPHGACAELRLGLLLIGPAAARAAAAEQIRALAREVDFTSFTKLLDQRRMLPLIGTRLAQIAPEALPADFARTVEVRLRHHRLGNMAREAQARAAVEAFAARGIRALTLKGPALAERVHGDIGLRSPGDVDLLVPAEDLHEGLAVLRTEGYHRPHDQLDREGRPRLHFTVRHPALPMVELHWRITWYESRFSAALLEHARPAADGLLAPDPLDDVAAMLLYFARDGFHGLRTAADVAAWWDRHGAGRGPGLLDEHLERYPELASAWRAAATALVAVTGIPAARWVSDARPGGRRETLAVRLACWSQRGEHDQLRANISLVDGLLTPAPSLDRFMIRAMKDDPIVPHVAKTTARFAAALWAVRREPWDPVPPDVLAARKAS